MTIYSRHSNRGKTQILATYQGPTGVTSATVTSVEDPALAAPIVDALNQISAYATVPMSVWDSHYRSHPPAHLAALIDRDSRNILLTGAHGLWYEQIKMLLHYALIDLDDALAEVPKPVQTAIAAELETEVRELHEALVQYADGIMLSETKNHRRWQFGVPFVVFRRASDLDQDHRESMNRLDREITPEQLAKGVADLRVLLEADKRSTNDEAGLRVRDFEIIDDLPERDMEQYSIIVGAPMPSSNDSWSIDISRWVHDIPGDERSDITEVQVLTCAPPTRPTAEQLVQLLNSSGGSPETLATWAKTPVGEALAGTTFIVTARHDNRG